MKIDIQREINRLVQYALEKHLISENEKYYSVNLLLDVLDLDEFIESQETFTDLDLEDILKNILDYSFESGVLKENSIVYRDLFDTKVMNCFIPRPDAVLATFNRLYQVSPIKATQWYYQFSMDSDYIRSYRVKNDRKWKTKTPYGDLDITINLSKPEKDPKAIAAMKTMKQTAYPKCQLCKENMGYRGRINHPARETIRIIPIRLGEDDFYLQYSPYSYYNEHCIVFNENHIPMKVDESCFRHLMQFVYRFPHYMLGSNADLPIVGGSILTHDHYQGGNYTFPMFLAQDAFTFSFKGYESIQASYLYWPLSVIRLKGRDPEKLLSLACKVLEKWRNYDDESCYVYHETDGVPHNTITPICHYESGMFVLDLTLRNNITTNEHPLGLYHPHEELWNIKKENIGLIEVMGTAILPSRLETEMRKVKAHILANEELRDDPMTEKHQAWYDSFKDTEHITAQTIDEVIERQIGLTFVKVLECAGVYKQDEQGLAGVNRFIQYVNND